MARRIPGVRLLIRAPSLQRLMRKMGWAGPGRPAKKILISEMIQLPHHTGLEAGIQSPGWPSSLASMAPDPVPAPVGAFAALTPAGMTA